MLDDVVVKHTPLSSFTWSKIGQVLITCSLGAAYDMTDLHYNTHLVSYTIKYLLICQLTDTTIKHSINSTDTTIKSSINSTPNAI